MVVCSFLTVPTSHVLSSKLQYTEASNRNVNQAYRIKPMLDYMQKILKQALNKLLHNNNKLRNNKTSIQNSYADDNMFVS